MKTILIICCGLILFLYALNVLSDALKNIAGDRLRNFIARFTDNVFKGILAGTIVTILLDSSSIVIIMAIALVNSGAMTFRQAMGIVLGANIGTAVSSQIFALDIGEYAAVPIVAGFVMMFFSKLDFWRSLGRVIFSFGLIFFGLFTMEEAVAPMKENDRFISWLHSLENVWKGSAIGAMVTIIIQSSSATVGMVIGLASQGVISLKAGIAVMLGAEIGTCADTLVASIGRKRSAVKTGVFHLTFNFTTILLALLCLPYFTQLVLWVSGNAPVERTIANAHLLFNILGVVAMAPFVGFFEKVLDKMWARDTGSTSMVVPR